MIQIFATDDIQQRIDEILNGGFKSGKVINRKKWDKTELDNHTYYIGDDIIIYKIVDSINQIIPVESQVSGEIDQLILVLRSIE